MDQIVLDRAFYILAGVAYYLLGAIEIMILVRVVLSWFMSEEDNGIMMLLVALTEPAILPFRLLLAKVQKSSAMPLDFSPVFASLTIMLLQFIISLMTGIGG